MRSIEGGAAGSRSEAKSPAEQLKALPKGEQQIVRAVMAHIQQELVDTLPELRAAVAAAAKGASFSTTLQIAKAKKGRFKATVGARIRAPREALELDMHVDDSGQLALGLPSGWNEGGEAGDGESQE